MVQFFELSQAQCNSIKILVIKKTFIIISPLKLNESLATKKLVRDLDSSYHEDHFDILFHYI